jgi:hypothetical protein
MKTIKTARFSSRRERLTGLHEQATEKFEDLCNRLGLNRLDVIGDFRLGKKPENEELALAIDDVIKLQNLLDIGDEI